jgi:hypothetical protein
LVLKEIKGSQVPQVQPDRRDRRAVRIPTPG